MITVIPNSEDLAKAYRALQLIRDRLPEDQKAPYDVVLNDIITRIVGKGDWDPAAAVLTERTVEIKNAFAGLAAPFLSIEEALDGFIVQFAQSGHSPMSQAQLGNYVAQKLYPLGYVATSINVGTAGNDCEIILQLAA